MDKAFQKKVFLFFYGAITGTQKLCLHQKMSLRVFDGTICNNFFI